MSLRLNCIEFPQHFLAAILDCALIAKPIPLLFTPRRNQCASVGNAFKSARKVLTLPYSLPLIIGPLRSSESGKSHRRPGLISAALPRPCWEDLQPHGLLNNRRPPLLPVAFNGVCFVEGVSVYFIFFSVWLCSCYVPRSPRPQKNVFRNVTQIVGRNSSARKHIFFLLFPVSDLFRFILDPSCTNLFLLEKLIN